MLTASSKFGVVDRPINCESMLLWTLEVVTCVYDVHVLFKYCYGESQY